MRNRFTQLLVPVLIFALASSTFTNCGDDNDNDIPAADTTGQSASISLKVDSSTLTFPKGGGTQTVTVTSPSAITVLTNAQWLQAVLKDNDGTSYIYDITADICTAASDRTGEITLLAGSEKATITATQRSTMSQTITVDAAASSFTIDDIPASVEVTCDALWISQNGNSFATSANTTNSERTGLVVIKFDSSKDTVFVTQKAGSVTALSMQSTADVPRLESWQHNGSHWQRPRRRDFVAAHQDHTRHHQFSKGIGIPCDTHSLLLVHPLRQK